MTERRPLVLVNGRAAQLPEGDTIAGVSGVSTWKEPVTCLVAGSPELVFLESGDIVMSEVS